MPRQATGSIETHTHADGTTVSYYARFRAGGRRRRERLGSNVEGWNEHRARGELDRILERVRRGTWQPATPDAVPVPAEETVHVSASKWWQRRSHELAATTRADYEWRLQHILRFLAHEPTGGLDIQRVDEFREQLREFRGPRGNPLSARSINMVLDLLAQILDDAVEYGMLAANPARGKRRRMKVEKASRSFLEPDMVLDLLDAAGEWERELPDHQRYGRRAFLAVLCLAGPRINELGEATRGGLNLHAGTLRLGKKTHAGRDRTLELSAFCLDELRTHVAAVPARLRDAHGADLPLFPTRTGNVRGASNIRQRLLGSSASVPGGKPTKGVVERVNEKRAAEGRMLLPARVTPHTLRRTFASLCFFAGRDLRWVMGQLGHADPELTLGVYAQAMRRSRIDEALVWRLMHWPGEDADAGARLQAMRSPRAGSTAGGVAHGEETP